ncbi:MAG: UDP-N-acetylmuramate dehydrogenase [Actinobacteria bacterium]|uniref:UDP-N-acetylmuramate dehydrogenase n=1 Tax=freshwater metagenome TaxID=449393 RepID=A0A6J7KG61_9ZZZZ|nr:UDP-N-acetylmuramate dehydrogenase [Actinomycetota bacterium]
MAANDLANFTTLGVGGPAAKLIRVKTEAELISAVKSADDSGEPLLIIGGGSNILVSDSGFAGTVIKVETSGNSFEIDACSGGTLTVSAGSDWDEFVAFTIEKGLANLESLSGIPGTVGGSPIQNIGAYGHEVSEVIARVRTFDRKQQEVKTFTASQCEFGYRSSIFKTQVNRYVILDVTFQLRIGEASLPIAYAELAKELGVETGARVAITKVRDAVLKLRSTKGMLLGEGIKSAGSFFINPILEKNAADKLPTEAPRWPMADGRIKTSAAWLMEHAGVSKGDQIAGAQISPKHVLALSNAGDATAKDLINLARSAQKKVHAKFGITLQTEVQLVGLSL